MKKILFIIVAVLAIGAASAKKIADFFIEAPMYEVSPYLDANMRLDLLDYFRSNLPSKTTNFFDDSVAILSESERSLSVRPGTGIAVQYGLAVKGGDSLLLMVETLPTPMPDSKVTLFDTSWRKKRRSEVSPVLADWLNDQGRRNRKRVEEILPFMTASAEFTEDNNRLVFTNTIGAYFAPDDSVAVELARYIKPQLVYEFNGSAFTLMK